MRAATAITTIVAFVFMTALCHGTEVYWTPAHHLAPQGLPGTVVAGDLDGDGDYDLPMLGLWVHYWNVGTPHLPEWEEATESPYVGVPECLSRAAALGDLDGDGDLDLVLTCYDEYLRFCRNTGTPQEPAWQYESTMFAGLDIVDGGAEPYLVDLDADDDLDILIVCDLGNVVLHFENTGTPTAPEWTDRSTIMQVKQGDYPTIALGDLDGDGDPDLVSVNDDAAPCAWENTGAPSSPTFEERPSLLIGVDGPTTGGWGIELVDIDADGDPDLVISAHPGDNFLYLNERVTPVEPSSWGRIKALYRQ